MDCPDTCSILVNRDKNGEVRLRGNPDHPFTQGFVCRKASGFVSRLRSPNRIIHPMLRRGDTWERMGWDDALDLCAEQISRCRAEPTSILHLHGEGAKGVLKQAGKLFFSLLGATEARGSLCDSAGYVAFLSDFGSRDNHDPADLLNASRIVNWGKDFTRSSVHMANLIRQARRAGTRVLTLSPGGDDPGFSDHRIVIRPGTDRFLAAAAIRTLLDRDGVPPGVTDHAAGFESFRNLILDCSPERLLSVCEVHPRDLAILTEFYSEPGGPTATVVGTGLQRYDYGGENARFINALAFLSGNIGRSGGGSYHHHHSLRNLNFSWTKIPGKTSGRSFLKPVIGREILNAVDPPVRMIWVNGFNIVNQAPNSLLTARAFESVPFKVVVDGFMTDTAARADLILPCALMLEQEDIVGSYFHDFIHHVRAVLDPPGEVRTDYDILADLGKRLDPPILLPDPQTIFRASLDMPVLDTTPEELRAAGSVRARRPSVAYEGMQFAHSDGKYRFPRILNDEPPPLPGYPLRLLSLIRGEAIHSQIPEENQVVPPPVWVAPECRVLAGLDLNRPVFLCSPLGCISVTVKVLSGLHPGTVLYRRGDWMRLGGGINRLIEDAVSDIGGGAPYYRQYARLVNERP